MSFKIGDKVLLATHNQTWGLGNPNVLHEVAYIDQVTTNILPAWDKVKPKEVAKWTK